MSEILKSMTFSPSRRERQPRVQPIQGLNGGFLIDAKHYGIRGRFEIQPDNVRRLFSELRVIAGHVATQLMQA